ncbi:hypothetical protein E0Z10_g10644 [Xylaria hypoxylon]|uniref:3'-5' exonuclease domain-containing protein n=1 Tax=Xylaria hypoxylon TaxID=37992 RepID=A0A4Z0Y319_9PEZI|nr:hypothetical protein E0Z10_g10644 [Xylaria hypoxylon]
MTFLGSSETAGNAVRRSSSVLPTPPRNNRLWHPVRGISFSPGPAPLATPARSPRSMVDVSARSSQYHTATSQSIDTQSETWDAAMVRHETSAQNTEPIPPNSSLQKPPEQASLCVSVQTVEEAEAEAEAEANGAEWKATDDPPPSVVEYKMADDLFYAAKNSPPGSPGSFWSYAQYRRTAQDGTSHKVTVHYCRSRHTMEQVCKQYFMDEKVLGFDLEWMINSTQRDGVKKNVSLIQLASPSRIGLFHVALFADSEDMVGPSFRSLMEDPNVLKAGVSIKGDTTRLRNFLDIDSRGLMELSHLYKLVTYSRNRQYHNINRRLVPLATQVEEYLHLPLFKGQNVRTSDWSRPLDMNQVIYSASDAYAGLQLFATLEHHRRQLDPCPPSPHRAELNLAVRFADGIKVAAPEDTLEADDVVPTDGHAPGSAEKAVTIEAVSIEDKETASLITVRTKTKTSLVSKKKPAPTTSRPKSPERPKDSRVEVAEDRVTSYRLSHPQTRSSFVQLRAYYLWHSYDLSPAAVAQLLRDPPLKTVTVVQYVLAVVQSEKLPADLERLREAAYSIPQYTLRARWPVVVGMLAAADY